DGCNRPAREQSLKKFLWMKKMTLSLMISKMEFFRCLTICHTVLLEGEETPESCISGCITRCCIGNCCKKLWLLLLQGADTVIFERFAGNDDLKKVTREYLERFGSCGLRTLCLACRDLSPDMYESWNEKFIQAKSSLRDGEKKLAE
ncbi:hypothetical protein UlMin_021200, partial [Ulmus minor]